MARVKSDAALERLKAFGLRYPGAHSKAPWPGHDDLAVNDKTFAYLSVPGEPLSIGCKLPASSQIALMLPWVVPTPYGLGKSGWVTATPPPDQDIPIEMFEQWIDESYRAQAPKKLVAQLGAAAKAPAVAPATKTAGKKTAAKKPPPATKTPPAKTAPAKKAAAKTAPARKRAAT